MKTNYYKIGGIKILDPKKIKFRNLQPKQCKCGEGLYIPGGNVQACPECSMIKRHPKK